MANNKRGRPFKAESPRAKAPKFARISEAEPHERRRSSRVKPTARVLRPEPKFGEWDAEAIRAETETRHWIEWTSKITATGRKIYYKNSWVGRTRCLKPSAIGICLLWHQKVAVTPLIMWRVFYYVEGFFDMRLMLISMYTYSDKYSRFANRRP